LPYNILAFRLPETSAALRTRPLIKKSKT
jgi:hypothetical protein